MNTFSDVRRQEDDAAPQSSYICVYDGCTDIAEDEATAGCFDDISKDLLVTDRRRYRAEKQLADILDADDVVIIRPTAPVIENERRSTSKRSLDSGSCGGRRDCDDDDAGGHESILGIGDVAVGDTAAASSVDNELSLIAERDFAASKAGCGPGLVVGYVDSKRSHYKRSFLNRIDDLLPPPLPRRLVDHQFKDTATSDRPMTAAAVDDDDDNVSPVDVLGPTRSSRMVPIELSSSSSAAREGQGSRREPTSTRTSSVDISSGTASRRRGGGGRRKVSFGFVSESQF